MYTEIERLMYNMEEKLSKSQDVTKDLKQFVERDKSKDYKEYASVSVMVMNICTSYSGTNQNIMQSIYETTREVITKILSYDKDFCQEYFFIGKYVIVFFNTPTTLCIDEVLDYAALLSTIISGLDIMAKKKHDVNLSVTIGIDFGRVLRINKRQNNYSAKETFHGYSINNAIFYSDQYINDRDDNIIISESVRRNLKKEYQEFFKDYNGKFFTSKLFNTKALNWLKEKYPEFNKENKDILSKNKKKRI